LKVLKKQEKCLIKRSYKMTEENKVLEFEESVYTSNDEDVSFIEFGTK
jgi:hypothetical protein